MSDKTKDHTAHGGPAWANSPADIDAEYKRREDLGGGMDHPDKRSIVQAMADECGVDYEDMRQELINIWFAGPC